MKNALHRLGRGRSDCRMNLWKRGAAIGGGKTGIKHEAHFEQLYTFGRVNRDPFGRVVSWPIRL